MQKWITTCILAMFSISSFGADISQDEALELAWSWMDGNPVMSQASQTVDWVETFSDTGTNYSVYVVQLDPQGYLVLNSDDSLSLVVSFSAESSVDLTEDDHNAFRTMLLSYCENTAEDLTSATSTSLINSLVIVSTETETDTEETVEDELYGPFLDTSWNQCNPYNLLCPEDADGSKDYGYRAPAGCVPTAYAQVLNFHRWPYYGTGTNSYADDSGSITGTNSATFSDEYDWASMEDSYNAWNSDTNATTDAISELMYELGVAAEANYESDGTSSSSYTLGNRLNEYFYYDSIESYSSTNTLIEPMEADLRNGFPCIVSITNHAIVADGLMVDDGETTYHINYGWGGSNNGWFSADDINGYSILYGITAIRPSLKAFPMEDSVTSESGSSAEVEWVLPKRRTNEVIQLEIQSLAAQSGNWSSDGSEITGDNSNWEVISDGYSGDCWYAEESTDQNESASLILSEVFVPDESADLTFRQSARLYYSEFTIDVSTDDGDSYTTIYQAYSDSENYIYESSWSYQSVSLAEYAGEEIKLRFAVSSGGYYFSSWPGVRVDEIEITSGDWYDWESFSVDTALMMRDASEIDSSLDGQPVYYSTLSNLTEGTYTLAAVLTDTNSTEYALGPSFSLTVSAEVDDGDGMPSDWELMYGLDTDVDDSALDADDDGFSNWEEYICGTDPTNSASIWEMDIGDDYLPTFTGVDGRQYSIEYSDCLPSNSWKILISNISGSNGTFEVSNYESITNDYRFYRISVELDE